MSPQSVDTQHRLVCLHCSANLVGAAGEIACPQCGSVWPMQEGIPRFFQPSYYWGEMPQEAAARLLCEAKRIGWREAFLREFADNENRLLSVLDWQRASWLGLLGLGREVVALDVGSGYGAITQSLANVVGEVYSLEAIPERIEFIHTRLKQEGISNVRLVQATALDLPFPKNSFDLIVANGVLEWVGEWETAGNPRAVQVQFLSTLHRLLKDSGILVIGIENRFAYEHWCGARDHSGLPYTTLMPRWLATLYLRHSRQSHYRTTLNPKKEYRTYTYGQSGYRKLLAEGGFASAEFYWADPGYNNPYALVPLHATLLREHMLSRLADPKRGWWSRWRHGAKALGIRIGRFMSPFVSEYVILAAKGDGVRPRLNERLSEHLSAAVPQERNIAPLEVTLSTTPFGNENTLCVSAPGGGKPRFILRGSVPAPGSQKFVESEVRCLDVVRAHLQTQNHPPFSVPDPLGTFTVGSFLYAAESAAAGEPLSRLLSKQPRDRRARYLSRMLPQCMELATRLALMLRGETAVEPVRVLDPGWWLVVPELRSDPELERLLKAAGLDALTAHRGYEDWVQHGSFTIGNLFLQASSGTWTVSDWKNLTRGLPPLYDFFSLLLSLVPAPAVESDASPRRENLLEGQFLPTFFGRGAAGKLLRDWTVAACERLAIPPSCACGMFLETLALRLQNSLSRFDPQLRQVASLLEPQVRQDAKFLQLSLRHSDEFFLPAESPSV